MEVARQGRSSSPRRGRGRRDPVRPAHDGAAQSGVGLRALRTARDAGLILDAVEMLSEPGQTRLRHYGTEGRDHLRDDMEFLVSDEPDALF